MTELFKTESLGLAGRERLRSPKTVDEVLPDDFNYENGRFTAFPLGDFSVMFLDPKSGEILDEKEVSPRMREYKSLTLYAPMAVEGDLLFCLAESFIAIESYKVWRTTTYFEKFENGKWKSQKPGTVSVAKMYPGETARAI